MVGGGGGGVDPEIGKNSGNDPPSSEAFLGLPELPRAQKIPPSLVVNNFSKKKKINNWYPLTTIIIEPKQKINVERLKLLLIKLE